MYTDEIIYCSSIEQLKQELVANGYYDEETQDFTHGNTLTPIVKNEAGASLSLVRNNKLDMTKFPSLTSLGSYEEMFADEEKHALYKSVYPYDVPVEYTDEEGQVRTYMRPERIGAFA